MELARQPIRATPGRERGCRHPMKSSPSGRHLRFLDRIATEAFALIFLGMSSNPAFVAGMSASANAASIDGEDSYGVVTGTGKWWVGTSGDRAVKARPS
jgi:hypothetical protein